MIVIWIAIMVAIFVPFITLMAFVLSSESNDEGEDER